MTNLLYSRDTVELQLRDQKLMKNIILTTLCPIDSGLMDHSSVTTILNQSSISGLSCTR